MMQRWWARAAAAVSGIGLALVVPALAWASQSPSTLAVADEVTRKRPRVRGSSSIGGLGTLCCCLVVVAIVVLVVVLLARKRRR